MSNVIRPDFGGKRRNEPAADDAQMVDAQVVEALALYGEEAGYRVGLVQDDTGPEGLVFRVFVGACALDDVETVAVLPPTPEGRVEADAIGLAILRTLEIIASDQDLSGAT
ncbi:hypothetical protein [Methylobacterium planeticum]|uniref:Uncharacterized protein n=1 Tax=Methylobacterium planeticum TaxID=2615211 RepID=A0A6N6MPW4_9HYPH|nr:hypothetical protein [Methylobacterium planeticum]KAB1070551.1 hypothetical protein F6X51_22020 [Methylobacterium planeticum]